ncbi:hypothetical protein PVAND_014517 [Polypedilum vanderplanki]|uniref:Uncharacterized protein n=1 Tax=Polypedilum vanderplanki TaxID=319348 RepID=A0A9J6B9X5_POLVA|nr:hypothetical protein PVAND_014517 [Polypedilum vanderplanki]
MFRNLFEIDEARIILKIAAQNHDLWIIFDFDNPDAGDMNPHARNALGIINYTMNQIFVNAYEALIDDKKKRKARRILMHEICHSVIDSVFENNGRPYYENDNIREAKLEEILESYKEIISNECTHNNIKDACDGIIQGVFNRFVMCENMCGT